MPERIQEVYINSFLDRIVSENELGAKFTVLLPIGTEIGLNPDERDKKLSFRIYNLQLPNVLYNFPNKTSYFFWESDYNDISGVGASVEYFQINTQRVYASPSDLVSELNTKIQAVDAELEFSFSDTTKRITLTNNHATEKIRVISSFRYSGSESVLTFQDINDRLGFSQDLTGNKGVVAADGGTLVGTGFLQMNRTNCFHLTFDEAGASFQQTIVPSKNNRARVVANIPTGAYGTLSTLGYISNDWFSIPISNRTQVLRFSLLDDEFDDVSSEFPPNLPITMSIQFKVS